MTTGIHGIGIALVIRPLCHMKHCCSLHKVADKADVVRAVVKLLDMPVGDAITRITSLGIIPPVEVTVALAA